MQVNDPNPIFERDRVAQIGTVHEFILWFDEIYDSLQGTRSSDEADT